MKTYLFDFDGTLVDSMPAYGAMMLGILQEEKATYGADILRIITPLGYTLTAEYFIKHCGVKRSRDDLINTMEKRAKEAYATTIPAKPHVPQVLHALKAQCCSLNVLTASPHTMLDPCLQRLGLTDLFDHAWSCEDFGMSKSDTKIYQAVAARLGCATKDVIFLDDNLGADTAAKAAGMTVYGVFDASSQDDAERIKAVTDRYICDFLELLS
ncbi:MAG: HAD family phosphatase [Ruminococcaceae bacterium]|nr:HAD family phosphatase [Oscillospiraceae bacterium]